MSNEWDTNVENLRVVYTDVLYLAWLFVLQMDAK